VTCDALAAGLVTNLRRPGDARRVATVFDFLST
jgi:hypothetical protein